MINIGSGSSIYVMFCDLLFSLSYLRMYLLLVSCSGANDDIAKKKAAKRFDVSEDKISLRQGHRPFIY